MTDEGTLEKSAFTLIELGVPVCVYVFEIVVHPIKASTISYIGAPTMS